MSDCTVVFLPEFSERLSPRRPLDFQGASQCTGRPAFVFPPPLQKVAWGPLPAFWVRCTCITRWGGGGVGTDTAFAFRSASIGCRALLPGSLGCGVHAPDDPFCFYQNLRGCKALLGSLGAPESCCDMLVLELEGLFSAYT